MQKSIHHHWQNLRTFLHKQVIKRILMSLGFSILLKLAIFFWLVERVKSSQIMILEMRHWHGWQFNKMWEEIGKREREKEQGHHQLTKVICNSMVRNSRSSRSPSFFSFLWASWEISLILVAFLSHKLNIKI